MSINEKPNWLYPSFSIIADSGTFWPEGNWRVRRSLMVKHGPSGNKFRMDVASESYDLQSWSELDVWDGNQWFRLVKAPTNLGFSWADGRVAPATNLSYSRDFKQDAFDGILGTLCGIAAKFVSTKNGQIYSSGGGKGREGYVTFDTDWAGRHFAQTVFAIDGKVFSVFVKLDESHPYQSEAVLRTFGSKDSVRHERADLFERYAKGDGVKSGYWAVAGCVRWAFKDFSKTAEAFV